MAKYGKETDEEKEVKTTFTNEKPDISGMFKAA